mgnify:CR=1 FL=1
MPSFGSFHSDSGVGHIFNTRLVIGTVLILQWGVKFFLFCPYLTAGGLTKVKGVTLIVAPASVLYENGAEIDHRKIEVPFFTKQLEPVPQITLTPSSNGNAP